MFVMVWPTLSRFLALVRKCKFVKCKLSGSFSLTDSQQEKVTNHVRLDLERYPGIFHGGFLQENYSAATYFYSLPCTWTFNNRQIIEIRLLVLRIKVIGTIWDIGTLSCTPKYRKHLYWALFIKYNKRHPSHVSTSSDLENIATEKVPAAEVPVSQWSSMVTQRIARPG